MFDIIHTNRFGENEHNKKGSMMRNPLRKIGVSALALTLASGSFGAFEFARDVSAPQNSPSSAAFAPMVAEDSVFSICVTLDKKQLSRLLDTVLDQFVQVSGANSEPFVKLKGLIEPYKADPFRDAPEEVHAFLHDSGLYDADLRWVVVSLDEMPVFKDDNTIPIGSAAVAGRIDLKKFIPAYERLISKNGAKEAEFKEVTVEGEAAWRLVQLDETTKKNNTDTHIACLDNQLAIAALSPDSLAKQIRLYRSGRRKSPAPVGFSPARGSLVSIYSSEVGKLVQLAMKDSDAKAMTQFIPNGEEILFGLKDSVLDVTASPEGRLGAFLRVNAASEEHAEVLRTLVKTGLMLGRAQLARSPEKSGDLLKVLEAVKVGGMGNSFEVSIDISLSDVVNAVYPLMVKQFEEPGARRSRRQMKSYSDDDLK